MVSLTITVLLFIITPFVTGQQQASPSPSPTMYPFPCSKTIPTCKATLYHSFSGHTPQQLASFYSVPTSDVQPLHRNRREDYIITVPCSCLTVTSTTAYFYPVTYPVQQGDTFSDVSSEIYRGQVWVVGNEAQRFVAGDNVTLNLLCGCEGDGRGEIVTYTVENGDTLSDIGHRFHASLASMVSLNQLLGKDTAFIDVGWVLYVPQGSQGVDVGAGDQSSSKSRTKKLMALIVLLPLTAFLLAIITFIFLYRRKRTNQKKNKLLLADGQKGAIKFRSISTFRTASSIPKSFKEFTEDFEKGVIDSEGPVLYSIEEIQEATNDFDESKKIGEGGYGLVFFGVLRGQEVAIKVMRSNKSKEFYAEVNVLCKIHHINVVELLGYASDDDHFFLVYEYVRNGSLSDHLHEPLLKGYQPLSWTARTQIAVDAAKGIESVKELQVTSKTDVFGFGVVLAELITGKRALVRDHKEPSRLKSLITTMAEIAQWCLSEEAANRPEMRDVVGPLAQIVTSSVEWEASAGGDSQVFSGVLNGR
ncbi:LysM domain receptor-like kinase 3 [Linum perenne]